jgi:hypothetical protein
MRGSSRRTGFISYASSLSLGPPMAAFLFWSSPQHCKPRTTARRRDSSGCSSARNPGETLASVTYLQGTASIAKKNDIEKVTGQNSQGPALALDVKHWQKETGFHVCSRTTSTAFLSVRSPRNTGCRISDLLVHSVNFTSATSFRIALKLKLKLYVKLSLRDLRRAFRAARSHRRTPRFPLGSSLAGPQVRKDSLKLAGAFYHPHHLETLKHPSMAALTRAISLAFDNARFFDWLVAIRKRGGCFLLDHCCSLASPFLQGHWPIGNYIFADRVVDVLQISPTLRHSVFHPEDASGDVGRHVLDVGRVHRLLRASRHKDLHGVITLAVGALIKRSLDAVVSPDGVHDHAAGSRKKGPTRGAAG